LEESDLSQEKNWHHEQRARKCLEALKRNNIGAFYARDREEGRSIVMRLIPDDAATVGLGDSVTLLQMGVSQEIERKWGDRSFDPLRTGPDGSWLLKGQPLVEAMKSAAVADVFLTSANAITLDGKLVNTDGMGNRVAPLAFGPKKVIVVCGANKIVANLDAAMERIKNVAAPINARRHYMKHGGDPLPCAESGDCVDCRHPRRICNVTLIVECQRPPRAGREPRINVVLVGEELGI